MSKAATIHPDFSHRLASSDFQAGSRLDLYDTVSLMVARIECTARLLARIATEDRNLDMAEALNALSVDAEDIRETVKAWCGRKEEETTE